VADELVDPVVLEVDDVFDVELELELELEVVELLELD
jgi:hypothetical protein